MSAAMELFERAAGARAQLLRVERAASGEEGVSPVFLLTFDVGRVLLRADPLSGRALAEFVESRDAVPMTLASADEEEPWWRLLGTPLARVAEVENGTARGLRLEFRSDRDQPRFVALLPEGGCVRALLEK